MPTYIYRCARCGNHLEVFQSFVEDPLKRHDGGCGGQLTKVLSPVGIVLKGSGFYRNDSGDSARSRSKKRTEKPEKPEKVASEASGTAPAPAPSGSSKPETGRPSAKQSKDGKKTA